MDNSSMMYSKGLIKMEEQTVPSAGFSPPQSNPYDHYIPKFQQGQNYGPVMTSLDDPAPYGNLADTFDLSLLGDTYDDHDMATVPSPGSWIPSASMEPTCWQQISLYAASPLGSDCYGAFSPDSKPSLLSSGNTSPAHSAYDGNISVMCHSPQTPSSAPAMSPMSASENDRNLLLRQCLEDMSFQRKNNFKPMDLPSFAASTLDSDLLAIRESIGSNNGTSASVGSNLELNQIEPVFSLAFEQIRSDIQNTCSALGISPDPMQWSSSDVQCWLAHTLSSLPGGMMTMSAGAEAENVSGLLTTLWTMDGLSLYSLTEEEFRRCDPVNGDRVFAQLELWKMLQGKSCAGPTIKMEDTGLGCNSAQDAYLDQLLMGSPAMSPVGSMGSPASQHEMTVPALVLPSEEQDTKLFSSASSDTSCSSTDAQSPLSVHSVPEPMATDDEDEEEEAVEKKPVVGKTKASPGTSKSGAHIHLWQFLKELLASPQQNGSCIRWLDQSRGVFKIEDSVRVARLWGLRKNRPAMNYDKLSRSIRQYYRKGIMRKTERSQRLVYQFCHPYGL